MELEMKKYTIENSLQQLLPVNRLEGKTPSSYKGRTRKIYRETRNNIVNIREQRKNMKNCPQDNIFQLFRATYSLIFF